MSILQNLVQITEGVEGVKGVHKGLQKLVEANGAAELAITTAVAATVRTSISDDLIQDSSAGETIRGQAGNDTLIGNAENDVVDGGKDLSVRNQRWRYGEECANRVWRITA